MTGGDRIIVKTWAWLGVVAAVIVFGGALTSFIPFVVFLMPVAILPTLWLYLTVAGLLYLTLRRWSVPRWLSIGTGLAVTVAVGWLVPTVANGVIDRRVDAMVRNDIPEKPLLPASGSIAFLGDDRLLSEGKCDFECQRVLFSGLAPVLFQSGLGALTHPARSPVPVMRHSIVPRSAGCDNGRLDAVRADEKERQRPGPLPWLWDKIDDLVRAGKCFRSDRTRDAVADYYFIRLGDTFDDAKPPFIDASLLPIATPKRAVILMRKGGKLVPVFRRTRVAFSHLTVPLCFAPPSQFDSFAPGGWCRADVQKRERQPWSPFMLDWVRNDLRIRFDSPRNTP